MKAINIPVRLPLPFANNAGIGFKNNIPVNSQIGIEDGRASLTDGFPPITFTELAAGGQPPFGADFNGILNEITDNTRWANAGGKYTYNSAFATAIGGYSKGSEILSSNLVDVWQSTIDDNLVDPDAGASTNWVMLPRRVDLIKFVADAPTLTTTKVDFSGQQVLMACHTSGSFGWGFFYATPSAGLIIDNGVVFDSGTAGYYWVRKYSSFCVDITWYGAVPTKSGIPTDCTSIVQAAMDSVNVRGLYFPNGRYGITYVTKTNPSLEIIYGEGASWLALATSATRCQFDLRTGNGFKMFGIQLSGLQNQNYTCGMHWYTNDLTLYYPGKANLKISSQEFLLGIVTGALPSQTAYYAQNTVQSVGIATDAPLSENITEFTIKDCPRALWVSQPNGKLTLTNSYLEATAQSWSAGTRPSQSTYETFVLERFGEISFVSSHIENVTSTTGSLFRQNGGNVFIESCILESSSSIRIKGNYFATRLSKLMNFGYNSTSRPLFLIQSDATGTVDVVNSWIAFPYQNMTVGSESYLAKGVSDIFTEAYANAPNVQINLIDVELRDSVGRSGGPWEMMARGVKIRGDFRLTSFENVSLEVSKRLVNAQINNAQKNSIGGLIDTSAESISAYNAGTPSSPGTSGGLTFSSGGGTYHWGSQAPAAGLNEGSLNGIAQTPNKVLRLQANSSVTLSASTPSFPADPFSTIFVDGWIYIGAGGSGLAGIKIESRDFSDALLSTSSVQLGSVNLLGAGWQPISGWIRQPAGATKARLLYYVENGVDAQFSKVVPYLSA